jgi:hypothetical protein
MCLHSREADLDLAEANCNWKSINGDLDQIANYHELQAASRFNPTIKLYHLTVLRIQSFSDPMYVPLCN